MLKRRKLRHATIDGWLNKYCATRLPAVLHRQLRHITKDQKHG